MSIAWLLHEERDGIRAPAGRPERGKERTDVEALRVPLGVVEDADLGCSRIIVSDIEVPNMLADMV
jgi:hypothetical protein